MKKKFTFLVFFLYPFFLNADPLGGTIKPFELEPLEYQPIPLASDLGPDTATKSSLKSDAVFQENGENAKCEEKLTKLKIVISSLIRDINLVREKMDKRKEEALRDIIRGKVKYVTEFDKRQNTEEISTLQTQMSNLTNELSNTLSTLNSNK